MKVLINLNALTFLCFLLGVLFTTSVFLGFLLYHKWLMGE